MAWSASRAVQLIGFAFKLAYLVVWVMMLNASEQNAKAAIVYSRTERHFHGTDMKWQVRDHAQVYWITRPHPLLPW
jgi:hypothetical protein